MCFQFQKRSNLKAAIRETRNQDQQQPSTYCIHDPSWLIEKRAVDKMKQRTKQSTQPYVLDTTDDRLRKQESIDRLCIIVP